MEYYFENKETNHIYSDKVSILVLQLNQLGNKEDEDKMPDLYYWAQLFRAETWEEIVMLAEKNEIIEECIVTLRELSEDEKIQMECEARERSRRDLSAAERYGYKKGVEDGIEKGISNLVTALKEFEISEEQIIYKLMEKYNLTTEEAKQYLS